MLNTIHIQDFEIGRTLILLTLSGVTSYKMVKRGLYHAVAEYSWNPIEPAKTIREAINSDKLGEGTAQHDFFLSHELTDLIEYEKQDGTGWEAKKSNGRVTVDINSIFGDRTKQVSLDLDIYDTLRTVFKLIPEINARIFFRIPNSDFRFYVYICFPKHLDQHHLNINLSMATFLPKLMHSESLNYVKTIPEHNILTPDIMSNKTPLQVARHAPIKKSCKLLLLCDETKETAPLISRHILLSSRDPKVTVFSLHYNNLKENISRCIHISDEFDVKEYNFTDENLSEFVDFINRIIIKYINETVYVIFDQYITKLISLEAIEALCVSSGIEMHAAFVCTRNRFTYSLDPLIDWTKHELISSDDYFYRNSNYPNSHVYPINVQTLSNIQKYYDPNGITENVVRAIDSIKKL